MDKNRGYVLEKDVASYYDGKEPLIPCPKCGYRRGGGIQMRYIMNRLNEGFFWYVCPSCKFRSEPKQTKLEAIRAIHNSNA